MTASLRVRLGHNLNFWRCVSFSLMAASSCFVPYVTVFFDLVGSSSEEVGILASVVPLVNFLVAPLWSAMADRTNRYRDVFIVCLLGSGLAAAALPLSSSFAVSLAIVLVFSMFRAAHFPLSDTFFLSALGADKSGYGRIRMFGTAGWAVFAAVIGRIVDVTSESSFVIFFACGMAFTALLLSLVGPALPNQEKAENIPLSQQLALLKDWRVLMFLGHATVIGAALSIISNFLFLHLKDLDGNNTINGLSLTCSCLFEVPAFFFSKPLLNRFGTRFMLLISQLALILRLSMYPILDNPWWVLPIETLHGLMFGCLWPAALSYVARLTPPGLAASAQGVFSAVFWGLGGCAGAVIGGYVKQLWGAKILFFGTAVAIFANLALLMLTFSDGSNGRKDSSYQVLADKEATVARDVNA
eukprot:GILK01009347.1.p1 GENE.GILK01009347.1~~GILK01009347.1.p1  ORF type:complete len:428 (-),score=68.21 GILK01009347.1:52-1293(-)